MSLYGALFAGVSALGAQSQSMGMISDNIANVNTTGYKRREAAFESLVTQSTRSSAYTPGAVRAQTLQRIDQQGIIQQSRSQTDVAVSGNGFFVVRNLPETGSLVDTFYTRAGAFGEDSQGYLVNPSQKFLMGWPLDTEGNIPTANADLDSLVPVDVAFLGGITRPSTQLQIGVNLNSEEIPTTYPVAASDPANFTRSFRVYDAMGQGQELTFEFVHMTSPTATFEGTVDVTTFDNLFDDLNFTTTATVTGTVAPINIPAGSDSNTFIVQAEGETEVITVNTGDNAAALAAKINAVFSNPIASDVAGALQIDAASPVTIRAGGGNPMTQADFQTQIGLTFDTTNRTPVTFTVAAGANPPQTISIEEGDGYSDLVAKINALTGAYSVVNQDGAIVVATDDVGSTLTIAGVGGAAPQIPNANFISLFGALPPGGAIAAPPSPTTLVPLEGAANPQNWWNVRIADTNGVQITEGAINFNGSGRLNAVDDPAQITLTNVDWGNGADLQEIAVNVEALSQYSGQYNVVFAEQNGAELGLRTGVTVDREGTVFARFSNGETVPIYQLPLATFANSNGLEMLNGNVFQETTESGEFNLREAGQGGAGLVESSSLEASNVDLADEFSRMIVTQQAYNAGTRVISTTDEMLQELLRLR